MQDKNRKDNRIEKPRKKSYYIDKYEVYQPTKLTPSLTPNQYISTISKT